MANTHDALEAARAPRPPMLAPQQATLTQQLYDAGEHTVLQIADIFGVPRPPYCRRVARRPCVRSKWWRAGPQRAWPCAWPEAGCPAEGR